MRRFSQFLLIFLTILVNDAGACTCCVWIGGLRNLVGDNLIVIAEVQDTINDQSLEYFIGEPPVPDTLKDKVRGMSIKLPKGKFKIIEILQQSADKKLNQGDQQILFMSGTQMQSWIGLAQTGYHPGKYILFLEYDPKNDAWQSSDCRPIDEYLYKPQVVTEIKDEIKKRADWLKHNH